MSWKSKARDLWDENNGYLMLAFFFGIVVLGIFIIYLSQVTFVAPIRIRFVPAIVTDPDDENRDTVKATLRVRCIGVHSDSSLCYLAIYNSEESFNKRELASQVITAHANKGIVTWEIEGLPIGNYSLAVVESPNPLKEDVDESKPLMPIRIGYSRNPAISSISFETTAVRVREDQEVEILLREP